MYLSHVSEQAWLRAYRSDAATKQNGRCCYCRSELTRDTISADHKVPRAEGGKTTRENIKAACSECNLAKGKRSSASFMSLVKNPTTGTSQRIYRAWMRRKVNLAVERSCKRLRKAFGLREAA